MRAVGDVLADMLDLEDWIRSTGPQGDDRRPLRQQYWLVLAMAPKWAGWSEERLREYETDLEVSYRDLLACARCAGECGTYVAGRDREGKAVEPRFYGPWTGYLVRQRAAWQRVRQQAEKQARPDEPEWPVVFAAQPCPGVAERRKAIRQALGGAG